MPLRATPTPTSRRPRAAPISDIFVDSGEAHFRALERAAVAEALAEPRRRARARRRSGARRRRPASCWPGTRWSSCGSGSPTPSKRVGLGSRAAAAARQRARPDQGAARRAHPGLRVGRHRSSSTPTGAPRARSPTRSRRRWRDEPRRREPTVIHGRRRAPYDVVVGDGLLGPAARRCSATTCSGSRWSSPRTLPRAGRPRARRCWPPTTTCSTLPVPDGERAKTAAVAAAAAGRRSARPASPAPTRSSPSAAERPPTSAASWPRPGCAACGSCTCRPRCSAWSTPRSAARPASTPRAGKNLVGSFHEPAGVLCDLDLLATLPRGRAGRRARRGRQVRLHRRPARSSTLVEEHRRRRARRRTRRCCASSSSARSGSRPTSSSATCARPAATRRPPGPRGAQLRPHHGARDRAGERLRASGTARRSRSGCVYVAELARRARAARRRASPTRHRTAFARVGLPTDLRPARPYEELRAAMAVDKKARGSQLRFVVLDGLAAPARPGRPAARTTCGRRTT